MNDLAAFLILLGHAHAELDMSPFHIMREGFSDIMKQTRALGSRGIRAELLSHNPGQKGHFNGMLEHILAVAGTVTKPPQQFDQFGMQVGNADLIGGAFTGLLDKRLDLAAGFFHRFLDACRMNPPVRDQFFQCETRHLAADRIKTGKRDGLRGIVDNQFHTGERFQLLDVAPLTADNAPLHLLAGDLHHRHRAFGHMVSRTALNGQGENVARLDFSLVLELGIQFVQTLSQLVFGLALHPFDQFFFGLFRRQPRQFLQFFLVRGQRFLDLGFQSIVFLQFLFQTLVFLFQRFGLLIQIFFFLGQSAFGAGNFRAPFFEFSLGFVPLLQNFFLGLEQFFFSHRFRLFCAGRKDAFRFCLGGADFLLRNGPA